MNSLELLSSNPEISLTDEVLNEFDKDTRIMKLI